MDNMENSSYHNDIIKGFDFNREDFKSPAKRNLMIGAEEADYGQGAAAGGTDSSGDRE